MKEKTKKKLNMVVVLSLVAVFILGTFLLYLPVGQEATQPTPPPLDQIPDAQQNQGPPVAPPNQAPPAVPAP